MLWHTQLLLNSKWDKLARYTASVDLCNSSIARGSPPSSDGMGKTSDLQLTSSVPTTVNISSHVLHSTLMHTSGQWKKLSDKNYDVVQTWFSQKPFSLWTWLVVKASPFPILSNARKAFYCANLQETIQQCHLTRPFDHQVIHFYPMQWTYINSTLVHGTSHTGNLNWMVLLTCSHFKTGDTHFV